MVAEVKVVGSNSCALLYVSWPSAKSLEPKSDLALSIAMFVSNTELRRTQIRGEQVKERSVLSQGKMK